MPEDDLARVIQELEESLANLDFIVVDERCEKTLTLPNNIGWVKYRPLSGIELDKFEEQRIKTKWQVMGGTNEVAIISDWGAAFRYLFRTAILDFEITVGDKVVRAGDFKNKEEMVKFLERLHWKIQRYIGLKILYDSGWTPPRAAF